MKNAVALVGQEIGDFRLLELIGRGAVGAVFRGENVTSGEICALKILSRAPLNGQDGALERISREAQAQARLRHANIVRGLGCGRSGDYYFFAMEFVKGESLESLYRRRGRLKEREALTVAVNVTKALQHAYTQGVVHRDIKPANIIISDAGQIKVTDFGMSKLQSEILPYGRGEGTVRLAVGTPRFMSPEQARGDEDIDIRSDIYSLGITLFSILAGQFPFRGSTRVIMAKHARVPLPFLRRYAPEVSEPTERLVEKMTRKKREDRYQTPSDLLCDTLAALLAQPSRSSQDAHLS